MMTSQRANPPAELHRPAGQKSRAYAPTATWPQVYASFAKRQVASLVGQPEETLGAAVLQIELALGSSRTSAAAVTGPGESARKPDDRLLYPGPRTRRRSGTRGRAFVCGTGLDGHSHGLPASSKSSPTISPGSRCRGGGTVIDRKGSLDVYGPIFASSAGEPDGQHSNATESPSRASK